MNILITGGCGYVGTVLTETLLSDGHKITVIDTQWFGNHLKEHLNLINIKSITYTNATIRVNNLENAGYLVLILNGL